MPGWLFDRPRKTEALKKLMNFSKCLKNLEKKTAWENLKKLIALKMMPGSQRALECLGRQAQLPPGGGWTRAKKIPK